MCKKILRILSLALALLLVVTAVAPASVSAAATKADEIKQQIKATYRKACSYYGRDTFDGYCGALVNAELYLLGINSYVEHYDGRDQYDGYCRKTTTSGGYGVKAYPASAYSMREALNHITANGTKDAYNILLGIDKTKSTLGQRYGHACVIHAILDGKVYLMESYDVKFRGKTYPEGTPIVFTIDEFCEYYAYSTVKYDGIIHFGLKTYDVQCDRYPASFMAAVHTAGKIMSQPCESYVHGSSKVVGSLIAGTTVEVKGLYLNTEGEYWYQVNGGYVPAETLQAQQFLFDDVQVTGATAPAVLRQGRAYHVKGSISTKANSIYTVRAQIYNMDGETPLQILNTAMVVQAKSYDLEDSVISKKLTFRKLPVGSYRYELAAVVGNYYVENGQLQTYWNTVNLWSSDFQVTEEKTGSDTVMFDPCGGEVALNQTAVAVGSAIGSLPTAQREGYVFLGWFTDSVGGERVTEEFVPDDSTTLYAQWSSIEELQNYWQEYGDSWYFYSDGMTTMGCVEIGGTLYYFSSVDPVGQSWTMWTAAA